MDDSLGLFVCIIIVYIGVKIYFTAVLFKTRNKVGTLQEILDNLQHRINDLQNTVDDIKAGIAVPEKNSTVEALSELEKRAASPEPEQTLAAAETVPSPLQAQAMCVIPSGSRLSATDAPVCIEPEAVQGTPPLQQSTSAESASPFRKETASKPYGTVFSVWIKRQCTIESVISKLGILLLLIGIGYVFKLAYNRGFIGKEFLLTAGCGIGLVLSGLGFAVHRKKRLMLSQVLFGGSIVTFYLTAFSAYMRYSVLSDFSAFLFLALITVCAYFLAAATASVSVSVIGLTGSLFIPFALGFDFFDLTSFGLYVFAVSALSTVTYFFKRWRILQFSSGIAFPSVLTWLLLRTTLTPFDAQLFLLLVMLLWIIHLVPDFYFHLSGKESAADKIASPIAAIINYAFSLFFTFKLSAYRPIPEGSIYAAFVFFYALFSYICLKKDKLKTLGYTFIALGILSVYVTLIDFLTYDIRPAAALGFAIFLSWLWRKEEDKTLQTGTRIVSFAGYAMAFYALIVYAPDRPLLPFAGYAGIYAVPMCVLLFIQARRERRITQTIVFQVYVPAVLFMLLDKLPEVRSYAVSSYMLDRSRIRLFYDLIILTLWSLYSILHYRGNRKPDDRPFYERSLYAAPVLIGLFIVWHEMDGLFTGTLLPAVSIEALCAGGLLALSRFKQKSERNRFMYRASFYGIVLKVLLIDGARIAGFVYRAYHKTGYTSLTDFFYWGILAAGAFVLLVDRYYAYNAQAVKSVKMIGKIIIGVAVLIYYPFIYLSDIKWRGTFNIASFIVNIGNAFIFLKILTAFIKKRGVLFFAATAVWLFLSFTDVYLTTGNNGVLTLVWGFYAIAAFIYFLRKADRRLVYASLMLIIIVSAKLVIIDLRTISLVSKTVTSILLGAALLILSYAVQPMLKKFKERS